MRIEVLYFASLRDAAGVDAEQVQTSAPDAAALYDELRLRHGLPLPRERLRVAVGGAFASWDKTLDDGMQVAFLPPMSGG